MTADPLAAALIDFWFGPADDPDREGFRKWWFEKNDSVDAALRERFGAAHDRALAGGFDGWLGAPEPALALALLLDQIPRNIHRGSARAFAADSKAVTVADAALAKGHDKALPATWRMFLYLPFEHSESLADQDRSMALFTALGNDKLLDYARQHRDIIARFGRFPHRNALLGRESTADEAAFLQQPGSSF